MKNSVDNTAYELIVAIACHGLGSKILKCSRELGITGGTMLIGYTHSKNKVLRMLSLDNCENDILLMVTQQNLVEQVVDKIDQKFGFNKTSKGALFSLDVSTFIDHNIHTKNLKNEGKSDVMMNAVFVVVERGNAELVVAASEKVGAQGATIINARGSGIHETARVFAMAIEPEKEIVLVIVKDDITQNVIDAINDKLKIDEPGNGILFTMPINQARGFILNDK